MESESGQQQFIKALTESQSRLYAYILTLLPDHNAAQDVLQNTNMVLWKKADQFDLETSFRAWSSSVAYYEVLDYRKRNAKARCHFSEKVVEQVAISAAEAGKESEARAAALQECLRELPKQQLDLIRQRYASDETVARIAQAFDKTEGALIQLLFRIRRRLAECIERRLAVQERGR